MDGATTVWCGDDDSITHRKSFYIMLVRKSLNFTSAVQHNSVHSTIPPAPPLRIRWPDPAGGVRRRRRRAHSCMHPLIMATMDVDILSFYFASQASIVLALLHRWLSSFHLFQLPALSHLLQFNMLPYRVYQIWCYPTKDSNSPIHIRSPIKLM